MSTTSTKTILAIASGGGHWIQLLRLKSAFEGHRVIYASVDPDSVARHRRETAESEADYAAYLLEYGPNGYKRNRWRHLTEKKRQMEVEAAGRATVADLYE
jgi:hypothetical protein